MFGPRHTDRNVCLFRFYITTSYIINNIYLIYTPLIVSLGIYIIGLVWLYTLCKQIYNERLTIQYIMIDNYDRFLRNV